ncbi:MAG TPA: hypothetical protein VF250_02465 [Conexibacter sp.]
MRLPDTSVYARPAELAVLVDELTEALEETVRLATGDGGPLEWEVHLDYLRAMQRVARETLAGAVSG